VLTRQTCISGHQDLHFATTEKDGHSKDFGNTKDTISAYNVPWDKLQLSGENRQNIKSYAGKQTKGASPTKRELPCTGLLLDNGLIGKFSPLPEAIAHPPASGLSLC
jgi:hypothetical protein